MNEPAVPWRDVAARLQPFIARRVPAPDVDDVLQDVFLRMHRGLTTLRDDDRMTAWMFQIARVAIADRGRDRGRHPLADQPSGLEPAAETNDDDRPAEQALASCLTIFVARLESPYREAVTLVELEGITIRAAAEMVGASLSAMKSRVQRGRAQLRCMLEDCCHIAIDARGAVTDVEPRATAGCSCQPRT
ncbi:MAG TPA: sigma-70 family RNA polymerase sigma factor [Kofleriaceae bacterium]